MSLKRPVDLILAGVGLILLFPIFAMTALLVRMSSPGPILFRQIRVGKRGRNFEILKFRTMTMRDGSEQGAFDPGDRSRVTEIGRILRATKLDELPQLFNVLGGEMSLVGPRPEVRKWVGFLPERWEIVHSVLPGITDPAAILYRDEEEILAASPDPERTYREEILPRKLDLYEEYVRTRTSGGDFRILLRTVVATLIPTQHRRSLPVPGVPKH